MDQTLVPELFASKSDTLNNDDITMEAIPIKPLEVPVVSTVSVPDDEVCNLPLNISTTIYQIKNTGHPSKENISVKEQTNCYKTAIWKQLLAILPVYTLQLCYGMSSGYPAITTPQLTMDYAQFPIYDDQESWIVNIDNLVTPGVCIVSGYLQHKFGPKLILNCLAIWRCIMIKFSTWAVNRTCSYIIKPSHGDDQHINLVDTLHGHQELCLSNASDKHLLHLLSFLIVQQSFFVVTGSNLTRLPPSLSEELSSVSVSDQCKVLLENFSNSSSKFTRCANQYAKPIFMCRNCVHDFIDVCTYYYALEHSQSKDKPGGLRPLVGDLGIIMEILSPRILVVRHKNRGANTDHQYHCKILALLFRPATSVFFTSARRSICCNVGRSVGLS